ncbi:MAG TPA: cyclic nucleotide-binding domain-containing protein [Thermoanaerobaculia bacterium]|nr:cyclic nucleotide-binding domain-containing protein [Thermoanaerobaculia bacterium]
MSDLSAADRAREAARNCEAAGLLAEADILYRLAVTLDLEERAGASASLARVLIFAGKLEDARPFAVDGDDPVLMAVLALEEHDFDKARRLLDEARARDPFDPRSASARGRLAFLEKRFSEAVGDLLEAALLRPDGLPDSTDARFLRAARALVPGQTPAWMEAATGAHRRLEDEARRRSVSLTFPNRTVRLVRSLIARGGGDARGLLERAGKLAQTPALAEMDDHALLSAAAGAELRHIAAGGTLYRAGDAAAETYFVVSGTVRLVRETVVGPQSLSAAEAADFVGEEALIGETRVAEARAETALTLLGFTPEFLFEDPDRAAWLRYLRSCLARRLSRLNGPFEQFFPEHRPSSDGERHSRGEAAALTPEEKSRSLTSGGLSESDRFLFAAFAEELKFPSGSLIFREGDPGDSLYVVARGRVRISRHLAGGEEALAILGAGEIFGEMAILDPRSSGRSADARVHEDALLLGLTRQRFEGLEKSDPEGCAELSALLCRLAARRCVETAERLAHWRVMAGPGN